MPWDDIAEPQPSISDTDAVNVQGPYTFNTHANCFDQHQHEQMELLLVEKGSLFLVLDDRRCSAKVGEVVLIPPKVTHSARTKSVPLTYHSVSFEIHTFLTGLRDNQRLILPFSAGKTASPTVIHDPEAVQTLHSLIDTYRAGEDAGSLFITSYFYKFFGLLYRKTALSASPSPVADASMREVLDYIDSHFSEPLSVAEISKQFGYAESHFCRRFKHTTGMTPINYIRTLRMEWAKRLLINDDLSISEVATACGFPDSSYFTRCFKKVYGEAPSQYAARQKKNA